MNLKELLALPKDTKITYKGKPAHIGWKEHINFLIFKADKENAAVYFYTESVFIAVEGEAGVTITTCHPTPTIVDFPELSLA